MFNSSAPSDVIKTIIRQLVGIRCPANKISNREVQLFSPAANLQSGVFKLSPQKFTADEIYYLGKFLRG